MFALTVTRRNLLLAAFYRRLHERGKQPTLALVSVMHKLLADAFFRAKSLWRPSAPSAQEPGCPPHFQPFMEITLDFQHGCSFLMRKDLQLRDRRVY